MIVAPQDQFYIEANLANCSFTQFAQYAHKKITQSCRSGNKAKFAYLPTQNTVPSKNLILNTMTLPPPDYWTSNIKLKFNRKSRQSAEYKSNLSCSLC